MSVVACEEKPAVQKKIDMEKLKQDVEVYGYVIIPDLIPRDQCERMSARLKELMLREPGHEKKKLQNLHGVFNALETKEDFELFVHLLDNPVVLELVEHMVGQNYQMSCTGALWLKPRAGASGFGWHADVPMNWFPANKKPMVNLCFAVNCLWMLTDFTEANGATKVIPFSHKSLTEPGSVKNPDFSSAISAEGTAGSCVFFNNALWHAAGSNDTDQDRIGVSNPYFPVWLDGGNVGWQPVTRKAYQMFPAHVQKMHMHVLEDSAGFSEGMSKRGY